MDGSRGLYAAVGCEADKTCEGEALTAGLELHFLAVPIHGPDPKCGLVGLQGDLHGLRRAEIRCEVSVRMPHGLPLLAAVSHQYADPVARGIKRLRSFS